MKKLLTAWTCVVALAGWMALTATNQSIAQEKGGTRIAFVNMYVLMKGYKKVDMYKKEMRDLAEPYKTKIEQFEKNYKDWHQISQDATKSKEEREKAAQNSLAWKRQIEDLSNSANKEIMERGHQQVVQLYREIEDAIQRYARHNGIHAVFHYLEPLESSERYSARNIERKLNTCGNAGACAPFYFADGMDISQQVVELLNSQFASAATPNPVGN